MNLNLVGDWGRVNKYFQNLSEKLKPSFTLQVWEDGEMVLEELNNHIDSQDLGWTPLSNKTIEIKGGDTTILVDTGELKNGIEVKRVKDTSNGSTIYIGFPSDKRHSSGMSMSELMIWLEYGTDKIPPRPLVKPTIDDVSDMIRKNWEGLMQELIKG